MKVFLSSNSSFEYSGLSVRSSVQRSVRLVLSSLVLRSQAESYYRKEALISRLGLRELTNSSDLSKVQLNFIMR